MKKYILLIIIAMFFISCGGEISETSSQDTDPNQNLPTTNTGETPPTLPYE